MLTKIVCVAAAILAIAESGVGPAEAAGAAGPKWTQAERERGYVVFVHSTLSRLADEHVPERRAIDGGVSCALSQGEYKSIQIGVHAISKDLGNIRLELESDLQARIYRPIDAPTSKLLSGYVNPVPEWLHPACLDESDRIASIGGGRTSFFWLTFHAGDDAAPGEHGGTIRITAEGWASAELNLLAKVRPFKLPRARIAYAPFFYVEYQSLALPEFAQTEQWLEAIFRDMAEHSHNSLIGLIGVGGARIDFQTTPIPDNRTFNMLLPSARRAGMIDPDVPMIIMDHNIYPDPGRKIATEQANKALDWYQAERRDRGWPELVTYGLDEPAYPPLNSDLRDTFAPYRAVRMRAATAMSAQAAYGFGDLHDIWIVYGGKITPQMCAEAGRTGAEIWTYIPAHLSTRPLHERYYAGLYVWAYQLKGHTTWHHYAGGGYKLIWMREGDARPMPLVGWETRREGVDDYRYLQMLEDCIAGKPADPAAVEAKQWLGELRAKVRFDPLLVEPGKPLAVDAYDRIRDTAAAYIQRLGPVPVKAKAPVPPTRIKDEAVPFRGKSVQQCIAGLKSEHAATRRAAAWALFEKGPDAAPAAEALGQLLSDDETCIPAVRALEAIGPASRPALEQLTALVNHPDGFMRMAACFALWKMGPPAVHALILAVQDDYAQAAGVARRGLRALGPAAAAALPTFIKMLDGPTWRSQRIALEAIGVMGPPAGPTVPHILRNWKVDFPQNVYWIEALAYIGPDAAEGAPALEKFREKFGGRPVHGVDARVLWALYRVRRSPADLRELVDLIATEQRSDASVALPLVENLGPLASDAVPQIQQLIAQGGLDIDVRKRLEVFLTKLERETAAE